jgi:hypothetical protein
MNCPNCHEAVEAGAAFCGNCGHPVQGRAMALGVASLTGSLPAYALPTPAQHTAELQATLSVLLGTAGIAGSMFIPFFGLGFGLLGIVMGTVSRTYSRKWTRFAGLVLSGLAVFAGLATWVYAVQTDPRFNPKVVRAAPESSSTAASSDLSTICYSLNFVDKLNIDKSSDSCDISAYNGSNIEDSTNAYKIIANQVDVTTANDFSNLAKQALEKDISKNLSGFIVSGEKVTTFANSPAYEITAHDKTGAIAIIEVAVMHESPNGKNIFVLVHANNGTSADLQILESQWQWK